VSIFVLKALQTFTHPAMYRPNLIWEMRNTMLLKPMIPFLEKSNSPERSRKLTLSFHLLYNKKKRAHLHIHIFSHSLTLTLTLSHSLSLSLTFSLTLSLSLTFSLTLNLSLS
jgi:hypothetical protein